MSKSIPQLGAKTDLTTSDLFHINRSNVDYKIAASDLLDGLKDIDTVKYYKVKLSQVTTNPPSGTVLQNTLSGAPAYSYIGVGSYRLTLASAFPDATKVFMRPGANNNAAGDYVKLSWNDINSISIQTFGLTAGAYVAANSILADCDIEIIVYP